MIIKSSLLNSLNSVLNEKLYRKDYPLDYLRVDNVPSNMPYSPVYQKDQENE